MTEPCLKRLKTDFFTLKGSFENFLSLIVPDLKKKVAAKMFVQSTIFDLNNDRAVFEPFIVVASISNFI